MLFVQSVRAGSSLNGGVWRVFLTDPTGEMSKVIARRLIEKR
jgi:hypothetical protein